MGEFLSPGHYYSNADPAMFTIAGAAVGKCALISATQRGPADRALECAGWADFMKKYGEPIPGSYAAYAAHTIWRQNPNARIVIQRATHFTDITDRSTSTAVAATVQIDDRQITPETALEVDAASPGAWGSDITVVVSEDGAGFRLVVKYRGAVEEVWGNLDMDPASERYALRVVNGKSQYVWLDAPVGEASGEAALPLTGSYALAGGSDGAAVTDADIQGDPTAGTGLYGFDQFDDEGLLLAAPGHTSRAVAEALDSYARGRFDSYYVLDPPEGADHADMKSHVGTTLGLSTDWGGLYWPRLWYSDPITGYQKLVPPSGFVLGAFSRTDAAPGQGPWRVAAGVETGRLSGVLGLETEDVNRKLIRDLVYPSRINPIFAKKRYGVCIYGSKTLATNGKQLGHANQRRTECYVAKSLDMSTQWVEFTNNDPALWARLSRSIRGFLVRLWKEGGLKGDTPDLAFAVKVDAENNPPGNEEQVVVDVGLAHQTPGQYVWFRFRKHTLAQELAEAAAGGRV